MNNKGFTLIEMIMVIAILAILTIIVVPNVLGLLKQNDNRSYNSLIDSIENAAKLYVSNNRYNLGISCPSNNQTTVTLNTLVTQNYLSSPIVDPRDDSEISLNNTVRITYNCTTRQFSYYFRDKIG